jgi:hypothetical protein
MSTKPLYSIKAAPDAGLLQVTAWVGVLQHAENTA